MVCPSCEVNTMTKKEQMRLMREQGLTYREIGEALGVSKQWVATALGKQNPKNFKVVGDKCIYPNLRKWMNDNKISRSEFLRRMGYTACANNSIELRSIMNGVLQPKKSYIDKMLEVTGLTYEVLFEVKQNG